MPSDKDILHAALEWLGEEVRETENELRIPGRVYRFAKAGFLKDVYDMRNGHYVKVS